MFRSQNLKTPTWHRYLNTIAANFCPYFEKSTQNALTYYSEYIIDQHDDWEEYCFALAIIHAEILRYNKRNADRKTNQILLCENIIFKTPSLNAIEREIFFQWFHWAIKTLYTCKGLLFGKFWPEEQKLSVNKQLIPDPPDLLLSIRSTVGAADAKFFNITPTLKDTHEKSADDFQCVFQSIEKQRAKDISEKLKNITQKVIDESSAIKLAHEIHQLNGLKLVIGEYGFEHIEAKGTTSFSS